jgi:DNA-binding response OmpR family regulator
MKILIVEDEKDLNSALMKAFEKHGFTVDSSLDGKDGLGMGLINEYDAIVLDLNLPELDGVEVCKQIRAENTKTPILALTARDGLKDKLQGFDSGFDDYLTKPFDLPELVARVRNLIRRSKPQKSVTLHLNKHGTEIKLDPRRRTIKLNTRPLDLTKIEFNILEYLLRKQNIAVSNTELIEKIWSESSDLLDPPIRSHIKNLRKKLGDDDFQLIETLPGVGYKV